MVNSNDDYSVTLYVNNQPRACFKSIKEAMGLCESPDEYFYMSDLMLKDASSEETWQFSRDHQCWLQAQPKRSKR